MVFHSLLQHRVYSYPYTGSQQQLRRYALKEPGRALPFNQSSSIQDTNSTTSSPITHRVPFKIRLDLPIIPKTLQRNNSHHTTIDIQALTSCQPVLEDYCQNIYNYSCVMLSFPPSYFFLSQLWQLAYL